MCVQWFRIKYKNVLIYAIPNEGRRSYALAQHMKGMGLTAGIPDLCVCMPSTNYSGLYVELKCGKNKPSVKQLEIMETLINSGYCVAIARTFEEFQKIISAYIHERDIPNSITGG